MDWETGLENNSDGTRETKNALVFMVVAINSRNGHNRISRLLIVDNRLCTEKWGCSRNFFYFLVETT